MPQLSLVIPAYNEAANLPLLFERAGQVFAGSAIELIIVDNGSTDASARVLEKLLPQHPYARSVKVPVNQGYGFGILSGLRSARTRFLGWTHADLQTDPADALRGLAILTASNNPEKTFVKGKRHGRPPADVVFTSGMSVFETALLRQPMWDINAQPTLFSREFFETWKNPPHDFSLDLFAYYMAKQQGLQMERFPVYFGKRAHGVSSWNVNWQAKVKFIRRTVDYSLKLSKQLSNPQST
jgi:glycosyltransferase involved in cell wall biosynthesis